MKRKDLYAGLMLCLITGTSIAQQGWQMKPTTIQTRWAKLVNASNVLPEYPRPQMVRKNWTNLNGIWNYAITDTTTNQAINFEGKILVPYPVESALSGVKKTLLPFQLLWYNRSITRPEAKNGERILLHFGAVDFDATVYINGKQIGGHKGGYQPFSFDVTNALKTGSNDLTIRVWDPSNEGYNPRGKQFINPGGIMYTPSSGIWQTVWMEVVPATYIEGVVITPHLDSSSVHVTVKSSDDALIQIKAEGQIIKGKANEVISIPVKNVKAWSPDNPYLYDLTVKMGTDEVKSYFGMRKIEIKKDSKGVDRIFLNNKYTYNLGTLDQGYWPDGLYTAPTDEGLAFDIKAAKAMGFNTIRKHIKIEPARWYYHCDKLGMMVWQDMVNPGGHTRQARQQFEKESAENITHLYNHPCITTWVLFNESWGDYDQARLTKWIKDTDPTRLVNGHSGSMIINYKHRGNTPERLAAKSANSDMTDVHSYPPPGMPAYIPGKAMVLGEFGGIGVPIEGHLWDDLVAGWGYDGVVTPAKMQMQYTQMIDSLKVFEQQGLSASIYTQPFDVESEQNGLMTYDREVIKLPISTIKNIHARLWPITQNAVAVTKGFTASVADTGTISYAARLKQFKNGKGDSVFLRRLVILANAQRDTINEGTIVQKYLSAITEPLCDDNLRLLFLVTQTSADPGFMVLLGSLKKLGGNPLYPHVNGKVQDIVFNDRVKPILNENPDWNGVDAIISEYPPIDGELVNGRCVIYYLYATRDKQQKNTTKNVVDAATRYDERYKGGDYNTWAWALFETTNDKIELEKALEWSKKSIEREPGQAAYIDTYSNLLHKLGRTKEALEWEEKALAIEPHNHDFKTAYDKMKAGVRTWPD